MKQKEEQKQAESKNVYTLFEEIKRLIQQKVNNPAPSPVQPQIELPDFSEITEMTGRLEEAIAEVRKPVKHEHHYKIDITSNSVFYTIMVMSTVIIISFVMMYQQRETLSNYKYNDLKYRYIQMKGGASPKDVLHLENVFESSRDSVKIIRKEVEQHEKAVREEAKRMERARLKEQEAERLKQEAEELKQGK